MKARSRWTSFLATLLALCLAAPQALLARYQPSHGYNMFSQSDEIELGKQTVSEVRKKLPLLPDSDPVTVYVQHLGAQLVQHAPGDKWPYEFHVVNQKEINAFAVPGGPIFVNLGTIQAADNEAELAGVMAHEISHVVQRHATRAYSKQQAAQLPLAVLGGILGRAGGMAQAAASFGIGSYFLHNSRKAEAEADLVGTDIMYDTGFNPHAMADFFEKLEKEGGSRGPQFFSDHPNPGNRAVAVEREVRTLPARSSYRSDSADFRRVKSLVAGMKPLTAQQIAAQQQAATGAKARLPVSDLPDSNVQTFKHNEYQIAYPQNWQVFGDATSAVTIAPQSGVSNNSIAYGVLINEYQPESSASLDNATTELLNSIKQSNPNLRVVGSSENLQVAGRAGKSVELIGDSPVQDSDGKPLKERDWLVAVPGAHGSLLYVVFIAPDPDFNSLRPAYDRMVRSLRLK
jgi:predicted Zn-dependent protease